MSSRFRVADIMRRMYKQKLITMRDGNVSFKPKNENHFYISAGSVKKDQLTEDQVIKVNFDKNTNIQFNTENGLYKPSRELYMHSFLHTSKENFDKDLFVVHAHPMNMISYLGLFKYRELNSIKDCFPEINVGKIGPNVKYLDAGSMELAKSCYDNLKDNDIIGIERHGSLSKGQDIEQIFEELETLEYYLDSYLKTPNRFWEE